MKRTVNQADADKFDLEIFNLMGRAESYAKGLNAATMKERECWETIYRSLRGVRSQVRQMMSRTDISTTT